MKGRLPNFLIVGAAKCGTSSLHNYLNQHPDIFMPTYTDKGLKVKEPRFLIKEKVQKRLPKGVWDLKTYKSLFEKALYQTKNRSRQDPLNFPIKLTNKLGHLNRLVTNNDFPPTNQDEMVRKVLTEEVEKHLAKYEKLISQDLKDFNKEFANLNLDYLKIN